MEEYLKQILRYLPLRFADQEANEFITYLSEAYLENLEKEKYQFAFKAFHMLYMTFVYKVSLFKSISPSAKDVFDYPDLIPKESDMIITLLKKTGLSSKNNLKKCLFHIDARNHCSHASGKIEYDEKGVDFLINDEIKYTERLQKKIEPELKIFLQDFLEDGWQKSFFSVDFKALFEEKYFSQSDLEAISKVSLLLFRKKSDNEKNIKQKVLYLLLIFAIQNLIEGEENLFLEKLPILMIDLPETIKVKKDEDEDEIYTSEIVEEFLIPIISNFTDEDGIKAEKILKFS